MSGGLVWRLFCRKNVGIINFNWICWQILTKHF